MATTSTPPEVYGTREAATGDRLKVRMAARLREETTMTVDWIAKRLSMGTGGCLNIRLYRWRKGILRWWVIPRPLCGDPYTLSHSWTI